LHPDNDSLVCSLGALPPPLQQQLSTTLRGVISDLVDASLDQQLHDSPHPDAAWIRSGANALLRALTREEPFVLGSLLPLLPDDAAAVLSELHARVPAAAAAKGAAANGNSSSAAYANGGPPSASKRSGRGGAAAAACAKTAAPPILRDDKVYLLISKLAATAAPSHSLRDGAALTRLLAWSSGAMKHALETLVHPSGSDDGSGSGNGHHAAAGAAAVGLSLEATYGAADLANGCVSLLMATAKRGGGQLPQEVLQRVHGLVDVALSVGGFGV